MQAEATVQRMFATVAVANLEFATFNVIVPPMMSAIIWTASPTDLSCVGLALFVLLEPKLVPVWFW